MPHTAGKHKGGRWGVGGVEDMWLKHWPAPALALVLVDYDRVSITNLNRQIIALTSTIGQAKVDVMARGFGRSIPTAR